MEARAQGSAPELISDVAVLDHGYKALLSLLSRNPYSSPSVPSPPPKPEPRKKCRRWLPTGWRRSALVNVGLILVSLLVLIGILAFSVSMKSNFNQAWVFYTSECGSVATTNTLLHLLVNIFSAGLFASSNFFMQVLNSPSMQEVKINHSRGKWLDIGIPSWRNAFCLCAFKRVAWICLFCSSLPIHLLFNSSIFQIGSRFGDFHLTIAAESFVQGGPYFLPGASLVVDTPSIGFGNGSLRPALQGILHQNDIYSRQSKNVSIAAAHASKWRRLDASECQKIYTDGLCSGLTEYRNVVLVIEGHGWKRSDIWDLSPERDRFWESLFPRSELNSLWYDAQCTMREGMPWSTRRCRTDCTRILKPSGISDSNIAKPWTLPIQHWPMPSTTLNSSLRSVSGNEPTTGWRSERPLEISHCLAEPRKPICSVALSRPLLLVVALAVFSKLIIGASVVWIMSAEEPLVTLGDAIASFIRDRDAPRFSGYPTQDFVRRNAKHLASRSEADQPPTNEIWMQKEQRRADAVPRVAWVRNSWSWVFTVILIATFLVVQVAEGSSL